MISLSIRQFVLTVIFPIVGVSILASVVPIISYVSIPDGWLNFFLTSIISILSVATISLCIGMNKDERAYIKVISKKLITKIRLK